jgi:hypothetical protein
MLFHPEVASKLPLIYFWYYIKLTIKERINPIVMRFWKVLSMVLFLAITKLCAEDFITKMEYAKMLYSNPRGIGCNKCHGEKGEGSIISEYTHKGKKVVIKAPNITAVSKEDFLKALTTQHKIMPTYFLTYQEMDSLHYYVSSEVKK